MQLPIFMLPPICCLHATATFEGPAAARRIKGACSCSRRRCRLLHAAAPVDAVACCMRAPAPLDAVADMFSHTCGMRAAAPVDAVAHHLQGPASLRQSQKALRGHHGTRGNLPRTLQPLRYRHLPPQPLRLPHGGPGRPPGRPPRGVRVPAGRGGGARAARRDAVPAAGGVGRLPRDGV